MCNASCGSFGLHACDLLMYMHRKNEPDISFDCHSTKVSFTTHHRPFKHVVSKSISQGLR